jgi:hypothetical protein
MTTDFVMGMITGVLVGVLVALFFTNIVTRRIISILNGECKKAKKKLDDREPADWWKDEDYDPREHSE